MTKKLRVLLPVLSGLLPALVLLGLSTPRLGAQSLASTEALPDAPGVSASASADTPDLPLTSAASQAGTQQQPFHFRGIVSSGGLVKEGVPQPTQTVGRKFVLATEDNFNLYAVGIVGVVAGYKQFENRTPEFGSGGKAYARYYWHGYADRTIENYTVEFIFPALLHQDTRYYYLGEGSIARRTGHAIKRTFITRSDSGAQQFNFSEIGGAAAAAGVSTLYYPARQRTAGDALVSFGTNVGVDALGFVVQEFYPSVYRAVFHKHP